MTPYVDLQGSIGLGEGDIRIGCANDLSLPDEFSEAPEWMRRFWRLSGL